MIPIAVADPGLGAKVAFLSRAESYAGSVTGVEAVETHMSWVFLTDRHAWKLKKPVRSRYLDFGTASARRHDCDEELRLNRRLSDDVYLDVVPLTLDAHDRLKLGPDGRIVDWLVKMRRLPARRMLDQLIRDGSIAIADVRRLVTRLARFYRESAPVPITAAAYREGFAAAIAENLRELSRPAYGLPVPLVEAVCAQQHAFLERRAEALDARVRADRIIEAHGDLRPEHICLDAETQIIDCLEFSRELRILDPADELGFLALECERLGAPSLAASIFETYTGLTGDAVSAALIAFYQSYRACVRAKIAIWHLNDPAPREPAKWVAHAQEYLRLAAEHGERAA